MKRLLAIISSGLLFSLSALPAFAVTPTPAPETVTTSAKAVVKADKLSTQTTNLQSRATQEIDRRLAALNEVVTVIGNFKKLSSAEKTTLTTQIQAEITNLTTLKTKIAADTDLATLKVDVKSIVSSYRVFALFIPKMHLLAAADTMSTTIDTLTTVSTKLDSRIKEAETAGKSVTSLKTTLTDMQAKLADAKKQYESIITNVTPLAPEGYPGNKTTLISARELLKTGRKDLGDAAKDARSIITSLKAFRPVDKTASSSATPTIVK